MNADIAGYMAFGWAMFLLTAGFWTLYRISQRKS